MTEIEGTFNKILEIDVSQRSFITVKITERDRRLYLGGKGLGLKLLYDRMEAGTDPLGPDNILAIMTGVISGTTAPNASRFSAVTKSPLTGIFTTSSCGGSFGTALKTSGWDGILIKGRAQKPVYLVIDSNGVLFKDAASLMGKTTGETTKYLEKEGKGSLVIGPAGENGVRFANIASGHRFLGRGGMGAVLGSKAIKGIVAKGGEFKIIPKQKDEFRKIARKGFKFIDANPMTSIMYRNYGTAANVNPCNKAQILPVRNFIAGSSREAFKISGETFKKEFNTSFQSCKQCSILCGHKGNFKGKEIAVPEYETVGLLGSNLEIFDPVKIAEWNEICNQMGMDTISAGGTLAWVMEAADKKLISSHLSFGSPLRIAEALKDIAYCRGFGEMMAMGTRFLSEKYGGKHFALQVKGLEVGAYDPRGSFGMGLNYAVANRGGCHLSTAIFAPEIFFNLLNPHTARSKHIFVKYFENLYAAVNSLVTCQFTAFAFLQEPAVVKHSPTLLISFLMQNFPYVALRFLDISIYAKLWSTITGIPLTPNEFLTAGERIHVLERYMNTKEGISKKDDTLPGRLLTEIRRDDRENLLIPLNKMLIKYYKARGYDTNGIPTKKTLINLGIQ